MTFKKIFTNIGKLILCGLSFIVGMIIGGMIASLLGLQPPKMPVGADISIVMIYYVIESPILALALALIARGLSGRFLTRTLILFFLTWVAYSLNTVLEASIFMTSSTTSTSLFSIVSFLVPSFLCSAAVAFFFSFDKKNVSFTDSLKEFFIRRTIGAWVWRIGIAVVSFMPIYLFFGTLVYPITGKYFQQNMFELKAAGWDQILPILFIRSILFFLACFPVIIVWQKSKRSLFYNLGFALFVLVGFLYMFGAYWMPMIIRLPHSLEILADSYVYSGVLVVLLAKGDAITNKKNSKSGCPPWQPSN